MRRTYRKTRKGVETIELAMVLLFFPAIVLGIIEFGRAFEVSIWLTAAAREGARLAMLYNVATAADRARYPTAPQSASNEKVKADVKNFLKAANIDKNFVKVMILEPTADPATTTPGNEFNLENYAYSAGRHFKVRVEVKYSDVSLLVPTYLGNVTLAGQITVRHE